MRISILDTKKKEVLNVVAANKIADLPELTSPQKYVEASAWMSPGSKYTEKDGVLSPVVIELTPDEQVAQVADAESALYNACLAYQVGQIDRNMDNEIAASRAAVIAGKASAKDLPIASAAGAWVNALWREYFVRKADAVNASLDFSTVADLPAGCEYATILNERETFLAGD